MTPIVIDLEWNYSVRRQNQVAGIDNEIIQIGAAKVDLELNITDTFVEYVRPYFYPRLNKEIISLTSITNEELQSACRFPEVVESFRKWCGEDFVFVSWGGSDIGELRRNCEKYGINTGWLPYCYDAQLMFDDMEMQEGRCRPLNYALYYYKEKPDGAHNALADVMSTILVLKHLDLAEGLSDDYFIVGGKPAEDDN